MKNKLLPCAICWGKFKTNEIQYSYKYRNSEFKAHYDCIDTHGVPVDMKFLFTPNDRANREYRKANS